MVADMMFHWLKILVTKTHDLSLIPGTYTVERYYKFLQVFLLPLHSPWRMSATSPNNVQTDIHSLTINLKNNVLYSVKLWN